MRMTRQIENFHFIRVFVEFGYSIYHVTIEVMGHHSPLSIFFFFFLYITHKMK
jgi:hypothetical protein